MHSNFWTNFEFFFSSFSDWTRTLLKLSDLHVYLPFRKGEFVHIEDSDNPPLDTNIIVDVQQYRTEIKRFLVKPSHCQVSNG
jgi:hypothetical protein